MVIHPTELKLRGVLTILFKNSWKYGCGYSKDDLKERKVPCFMIIPAKTYVDEYESDYLDRYLDNPDVRKYYFGDIL